MKKFAMTILVFLLSCTVIYARDLLDVSRRCSISFKNVESDVKMFKIASVNAYADFTIEDKYNSYPVDYSNYDALALTLSAYIARDGIEPEYEFTGNADNLDTGLYLIMIDSYIKDDKRYEFSPFMISLPYLNEDDSYNYTPAISPKKSITDVTSITVIKNWDDGNGAGRPTEIVIELMGNNTVLKEETLNAANGFRCNFNGLDVNMDYCVTEKYVPEGYSVSIVKDGNNFVITNKEIEPVYDNELPHTGQLWWPVPVLLIAGALLIILSRDEKNT